MHAPDERSADMPYSLFPHIGYCNGKNRKLNALEYHRSSEVNVAVTDMILLTGMEQDIGEDFTYDTFMLFPPYHVLRLLKYQY